MGGLARSYISLVQDLEKYVASLQSVMAEKERINAELSLASDIQAHILNIGKNENRCCNAKCSICFYIYPYFARSVSLVLEG